MFSPTKCVAIFTVGILLFVCGRPAEAQRRPQVEVSPVEAAGTVDAVAPMLIRITTETNQIWLFQLNRETKVRVTGTAKPDFLRPGMYIVFKADIDRKGNSPTKLEELKIASIAIQEYFPAGVFPVGEAGFGAPEAAANKDPNATTACEVRGMLTALKNGKATVNTGRGVVKVEVVDEPKIDVDFSDYTVAQKGDKIAITGRSAREGYGEASEVTVELTEPLTLGGKASGKGRRSPRDRKKPGEGEKEEPKAGEGEKPAEKPAVEKAEEKAEPKAEKAAAAEGPGGNVQKIVEMLQLAPDAPGANRAIKLSIGGAEAIVFRFSKEEPLENIKQLLGDPERTDTISGTMEFPGEDGPQQITLKMMDCEGLKLLVDEKENVRFYSVEEK